MNDEPRLGAGGPEPPPLPRRSRWAWIVSTLAALGAGLVLAFLLGIATSNPALYERHYVWLFWVNVALASALVAVIVIAGVRMLWRVSRGRFGSRLLLKLAAIFALVGILPGVLIYAVSYQFVSRSIETWFDVKVEGALDAGLNLGRGTIDAIVSDLATKTRLAAERLGESASSAEPLSLERLREQLSAREIAVVGGSGQTLLATGSTTSGLMPERVPPQMLRQARAQRVVSQAEGLDEEGTAAAAAAAGASARVRAVALIPSTNFALGEQERFPSSRSRSRPAWPPMRSPSPTRTASTSSARSPARACARCTSARSRSPSSSPSSARCCWRSRSATSSPSLCCSSPKASRRSRAATSARRRCSSRATSSAG
jgi:membrane-bound metal-dependent hydrolase YbcI (DUF457 family)